MRTLLLVTIMLFSVPTALACTCVVDDLEEAERQEYERADLVFSGYLVDEQLSPLAPCVPGETERSQSFVPRASFKVVISDKGVDEGEVIVANLADHPYVHYDSDCNLVAQGNSCQSEFDRSYYGSEARPIWMAFTYVDGELWANGHMCSAFVGEDGARIVAKYSKRDKS